MVLPSPAAVKLRVFYALLRAFKFHDIRYAIARLKSCGTRGGQLFFKPFGDKLVGRVAAKPKRAIHGNRAARAVAFHYYQPVLAFFLLFAAVFVLVLFVPGFLHALVSAFLLF
jgi:hypothetical protein